MPLGLDLNFGAAVACCRMCPGSGLSVPVFSLNNVTDKRCALFIQSPPKDIGVEFQQSFDALSKIGAMEWADKKNLNQLRDTYRAELKTRPFFLKMRLLFGDTWCDEDSEYAVSFCIRCRVQSPDAHLDRMKLSCHIYNRLVAYRTRALITVGAFAKRQFGFADFPYGAVRKTDDWGKILTIPDLDGWSGPALTNYRQAIRGMLS